MTKTSPQQMILEAVIICIEKYGVEKITTRKIAEEAGTNIASINYYFRSKDDLIAQALGLTLNHMTEDLIVILQNDEQPFEAVLRAWIVYLLEGAQLYPRVFMAHMYAPLVEKRFDTPGPQAFRSMLDLLEARAAQAYTEVNASELRLGLVDVISAMLFGILIPGFFDESEKLSPAEQAERYSTMFAKVISARE
jgi:AcrR family transcriptional regulator